MSFWDGLFHFLISIADFGHAKCCKQGRQSKMKIGRANSVDPDGKAMIK